MPHPWRLAHCRREPNRPLRSSSREPPDRSGLLELRLFPFPVCSFEPSSILPAQIPVAASSLSTPAPVPGPRAASRLPTADRPLPRFASAPEPNAASPGLLVETYPCPHWLLPSYRPG